jgi:hypothetical protein
MTKRVQYRVRVTTPTEEILSGIQSSLGYARTAAELALDHHPSVENRVVIEKGWDHSFVTHEVIQEGLKKEYVSRLLEMKLYRDENGWHMKYMRSDAVAPLFALTAEEADRFVRDPDNGFIPVYTYFTYR